MYVRFLRDLWGVGPAKSAHTFGAMNSELRLRSVTFGFGSAKLCIQNFYLREF